MICNTKRCKLAATDLALLALTILFVIGIRYWYPVCAPMTETNCCLQTATQRRQRMHLLLSRTRCAAEVSISYSGRKPANAFSSTPYSRHRR